MRRLIVLLGAVGLGVVAVAAALVALGPAAHAADRVAAVPNLITGLASLVGAVGYGARKKWGLYAYALSCLGHGLIHGAFLAAALQAGRFSPVSAVGLAVVPVAALVVLVGMALDARAGRLA